MTRAESKGAIVDRKLARKTILARSGSAVVRTARKRVLAGGEGDYYIATTDIVIDGTVKCVRMRFDHMLENDHE